MRIQFHRLFEDPPIAKATDPAFAILASFLSDEVRGLRTAKWLIRDLRDSLDGGVPIDREEGDYRLQAANGHVRVEAFGFLPPAELPAEHFDSLLVAWALQLEHGTPTGWSQSRTEIDAKVLFFPAAQGGRPYAGATNRSWASTAGWVSHRVTPKEARYVTAGLRHALRGKTFKLNEKPWYQAKARWRTTRIRVSYGLLREVSTKDLLSLAEAWVSYLETGAPTFWLVPAGSEVT